MKNLKQLMLAAAFVAAVSIPALAQKEDKKPPPKEGKPPVIVVAPDKKPPKEEKPKDGKKPQAMIFSGKNELSFL